MFPRTETFSETPLTEYAAASVGLETAAAELGKEILDIFACGNSF